MTKSTHSRFVKRWSKLVYSEADLYPEGYADNIRFDVYGNAAPQYKVGKQFPYQNARLKREEGLDAEAIAKLSAPQIKTHEQVQTQAAYLGRTTHLPRPARRKRSGHFTVLRSSKRKAFRADQITPAFITRLGAARGHLSLPVIIEN